MSAEPEGLDSVLKALADPVRRQLLTLLGDRRYFCRSASHTGEGICVQDLARYLRLPQSTASRHLAVLAAAGLVTRTRYRTWHYYALNPAAFAALAAWLAPFAGLSGAGGQPAAGPGGNAAPGHRTP